MSSLILYRNNKEGGKKMEMAGYFEYKRRYKGPVKLVILDWAGTTIDYGCFAPALAFVEAFRRKGIEITMEQARAPMGRAKWEHIKCIFEWNPDVQAKWKAKYGRDWTLKDVDEVFKEFKPATLEAVKKCSKIIPGVVETVEWLRERGIKIGSTTGYFTEAAELCYKLGAQQGYKPDTYVYPDEVAKMFGIPLSKAGRPYPWMVMVNMIRTQSFPPAAVVKVDDTVVGVEEGLNAGTWTVGVSKTGTLVGLSEEEVKKMEKENPKKLRAMIEAANDKLRRAGAHYVIEDLSQLPQVIEDIERRLKRGETPV